MQNFLDKRSDLSDGQKSFKRITVAEPQGENHGNSWHPHILLFFEDEVLFLLNEMIYKIWRYEITSTHKVYNADGVVLYFNVYLTDIEYSDEKGSNKKDNRRPISGEKMEDYGNVTAIYD